MMMRVSKFALLATVCLTLSACGEEWVPQYTTEYVPYGSERTAGSGVVYVRKSMLPPKTEIKEEAEIEVIEPPVVEEPEEPVELEKPPVVMPKEPEPAAPVLKADEMFDGGVK